jgi:molybdopterin converting factor subunit 1
VLVRARFFASHRERVGADRLDVEVLPGATVGDLVDQVLDRVPELAPIMRSSRYAVNREYLPISTVLKPGDEVAFIPPVAGGDS